MGVNLAIFSISVLGGAIGFLVPNLFPLALMKLQPHGDRGLLFILAFQFACALSIVGLIAGRRLARKFIPTREQG
jgi:hypothetical protein